MEFFDKLIYVWEIPVDFIRDVTIPCSEEVFLLYKKIKKNWNKIRAISNCVFSPIFFVFYNGSKNF